MKKRAIIFGIIFLGFCATTNAQAIYKDTREDFVFGVKAGINGSNVWDEAGNSFRADTKIGFVAGGYLGIPLSKYLGFQPEVLYSQKGFQGSGMLLGAPYSFSRTTTFIDVPLLLQVKPVEAITFVVGPQYSYLLRQRDEFTSSVRNTEQEQEFRNDNIRKNILGATFGADVILAPMVISGRVGWDLQANHGDGSSSIPRYKNQWAQLTLGFQL